MTLCERFLRQMEAKPDGVAVHASGSDTTYGELAAHAVAVAGWLVRQGLARGDRVAVLLPNSAEYVACYLGIQMAGGIVVALNAEASADELAYTFWDCTPRFVVVDRNSARTLKRIADRLVQTDSPTGRQLPFVVMFCGRERETDFGLPAGSPVTELEAMLASSPARGNGHPIDSPRCDDIAQIIYTSGTTGKPKGVTLTHGNIEANCSSILQYLELTQADSILVALPFFYSYGNSLLFTHLAAGGRLVLASDFVFWNRVLDLMQRERVTGFSGVPSSFAMLLHRSDFRKRTFPDLRYMTCAGGALAPAMVERLRAVIPHVRLFLMYGQTEATARLSTLMPEELGEKLGSIGRGIPGVTLEVLDNESRPVPSGEVGEIVAGGANLMAGYWNDPAATARVLRPEGLRTGDLARVDEEGYIYIVGRKSDMIKTGAYRINPMEIEEVLLQHAGVAEAAVVGMPEEIFSEVPVAFVVACDVSDPPAASEIVAHCRGRLPRYKMIRGVRFVDALPKTASGKIRRTVLREQYAAEQSSSAG